MKTLMCLAAAAVLLLIGCEAALPQAKQTSTETAEQKRAARVKAALLKPDGQDIGTGLSITVTASGITIRVSRKEFEDACSHGGYWNLYGTIDPADLVVILEVYTSELRKRQEQDARTFEQLNRIVGVSQAKPQTQDAVLPMSALPMSPMPKKALVTSR